MQLYSDVYIYLFRKVRGLSVWPGFVVVVVAVVDCVCLCFWGGVLLLLLLSLLPSTCVWGGGGGARGVNTQPVARLFYI